MARIDDRLPGALALVHLLIAEALLLHETENHGVRRNEMYTGIQSGDHLAANGVGRLGGLARKHSRNAGQCVVALPEDHAARLKRLDAGELAEAVRASV